MKGGNLLPARFLFHFSLSALTTALVVGCATQQQVKEIVSESNLASVSTDLGLGDADPQKSGGAGPGWRDASAKIEAFIAAHSDEKPTVAALRVRQAVMLLNNSQFNLAESAFNEASLGDLHSSRDRVLKQLDDNLLWWYKSAGGSLTTADFVKGSQTLTNISRAWTGLTSPGDDGIRDWLAAWRAFVGLKMANDANGVDKARNYLEDAVNTYASMLPAGEATMWQSQTNWPPSNVSLEIAISPSNRRRFRAEDIIKAAQTAMKGNNITNPRIQEPYFRERIK